MKKRIIAVAFLAATLPTALRAQDFMEKANAFSYSKDAYIYLESGDSIIAPLQLVDYHKGVVSKVKVRKDGEKQVIDVNTIRTVYFPISAMGKLSSALGQAVKMEKWDKSGTNVNLLNNGYVLFEKIPAIIKGKEEPVLAQLLNPGFAGKIQVYADFGASESTSYGIGGITLAGGDDLSYYFRKGTSPAERVRRKDFKEKIAAYFGDCPALAAQLEKNYDWISLHRYIYQHSECQ
ncbi:MAG: hypothetical protein EOP52_13390 [Sphingobacteriales bacterium]|nr:MAG: hypothetical protein EOP52_13390 [Sphingobacteriales bacterium]